MTTPPETSISPHPTAVSQQCTTKHKSDIYQHHHHHHHHHNQPLSASQQIESICEHSCVNKGSAGNTHFDTTLTYQHTYIITTSTTTATRKHTEQHAATSH
mmetsp:Transcript_5835/g.11207  ORF Transcript_5835/g.11207 Transcript_5835/m.11207 type:complete len:101 (-) Transcript_5835:537-839(-)